MKKKHNVKSEFNTSQILFYIAAALFFVVAIIHFIKDQNSSAVIWICLGSSLLCLGSSKALRDDASKKKDEDDEAED